MKLKKFLCPIDSEIIVNVHNRITDDIVFYGESYELFEKLKNKEIVNYKIRYASIRTDDTSNKSILDIFVQ